MEAPDQAELLAYLDQRLDAIVTSPSGWGDPFAVELQYLQAIEFRWFVATGEELGDVNRLWSRIMKENGYRSNLPLAHQTSGQPSGWENFDPLVKLLPLLRQWEPRRCSDCDGFGYSAWMTGCPACGESPPCEIPEEGDCPGREESCQACQGLGVKLGKLAEAN